MKNNRKQKKKEFTPGGRSLSATPDPIPTVERDAKVQPTPESKPARALRQYRAWRRRWLRSSKPTEWIVSISAMITIVTGVVGGVIYLSSGILDSRRSELEAKRSEITAQNIKLEKEQQDLIVHREQVHNQIVANKSTLRMSEEKLASANTILLNTTAELDEATKRLGLYTRNEQAILLLKTYSAKHRKGPDSEPRVVCTATADLADNTIRVELHIEPLTSTGIHHSPAILKQKEDILSAASNLINIERFAVKDIQLTKSDLELINRLAQIRYLSLMNCGLDDYAVSSLSLNANVNYLGLRENPITILPHIKFPWAILALDLKQTKISDDSLSSFLPAAWNLYSLRLANTSISDRTLDAIKKGKDDLDNIDLFDTKITAEGLKRLISRVGAKWVFLRNNEKLESELRTEFSNTHHQCVVTFSAVPYFTKSTKRGEDDERTSIGENGKTVKIHMDQSQDLHLRCRPYEILSFMVADAPAK